MMLLVLPFTGSCLVAPLPEDLSRPEEELWLPDWPGLSELSLACRSLLAYPLPVELSY